MLLISTGAVTGPINMIGLAHIETLAREIASSSILERWMVLTMVNCLHSSAIAPRFHVTKSGGSTSKAHIHSSRLIRKQPRKFVITFTVLNSRGGWFA